MTAIDPKLDLVLERIVDVPPEDVWEAWTQPEVLKQWFCPAPWKTTHCEIDLRPGGVFATQMKGPDGPETPLERGCYLEVVPNRRLVWTGALGPGFRPNALGADVPFVFTATIMMEPHGEGGTKYTAHVMHSDPEGRAKHDEMGFSHGWGAALDQLVALMKKRR